MKKMTIALFTAAAMGTSAFAVADEHGPTISGRVDMTVQDLEGSDVEISDRSSVIGVGGSSELAGGLSGSYFARVNVTDSGGRVAEDQANDELATDSGTNVNTDYVYANVTGDFGTVQIGRDDDIVYEFLGVNTDTWRGLGPVGSAKYGETSQPFRDAHLQYHLDVGAVTIGTYLDSAPVGTQLDNDEANPTDGTASGFNNYQVGALYTHGMGTIAAVYADAEEEGATEELTVGGTLDVGVATLAAHYSNIDPETGDSSNPYVVQASIPLTDILSANVAYGDSDTDADGSDVAANIFANLGGGFDVNFGIRNGDSGDGVQVNTRYSF